jgi:putative PIN family toxin of toxin-antitoxin system
LTNAPASVQRAVAQSPSPLLKLVIDTNICLDWLVFDDPGSRQLGAAIRANQVVWLATEAMTEELLRVLHYPILRQWKPDVARLEPLIRQMVTACPVAPVTSIDVCRDPDDQKFLDLAIAQRADVLFTKDKQLQRSARRCRLIQSSTPDTWLRGRLPTATE